MSNLDNTINQIIEDNDIPNEWNSLITKELEKLDPENNINRKNLTDTPLLQLMVRMLRILMMRFIVIKIIHLSLLRLP